MRKILHHGGAAEHAQAGIDIRDMAAGGPLDQEAQQRPHRHLQHRFPVMRSLTLTHRHVEAFAMKPHQFGNGGGRIGSVRIADRDHVVLRRRDAVLQRTAVSDVMRMANHLRACRGGDLAGPVARSVVDDDDLERHQLGRGEDLGHPAIVAPIAISSLSAGMTTEIIAASPRRSATGRRSRGSRVDHPGNRKQCICRKSGFAR